MCGAMLRFDPASHDDHFGEIPADAIRVTVRPIEVPEVDDVLARSVVEAPDVLARYEAARFALAKGDKWPRS